MASPDDLRKELECSLCLDIYMDPITLKCGHSFCKLCIERSLVTQEVSGRYSCPQCRETFQERPELQRNVTLHNIAESFWSTQSNQEGTVNYCTYCIHSPVPAVKSCLMCEASMCAEHLRVHSKSPEHVLADATTSMENRRCSVHKRILEYYCTQDEACICASCCVIGQHKQHHTETLEEACSKRRKITEALLQKQITKREEAEKNIKSLEEKIIKLQETATNVTERVKIMFRDIRRQLDDLEKEVLNEIYSQTEKASALVSDSIQKLEINTEQLSMKILRFEELYKVTDPLTVLQEPVSGDLTEEEGNEDKQDGQLTGEHNLDVTRISQILHAGFSQILTEVNRGLCIPRPEDILLDINTAGNYLWVSPDRKTVTWFDGEQDYPETLERFQWSPQVLSSQSFSSGRHYWEVDLRGSNCWRVGLCYPTIDRNGIQGESVIGDNNKSWCIKRRDNGYCATYDRDNVCLPANISVNKLRISLNYEAGQISFYELGVPIEHLHTFSTTFTEPLHAALCVWEGCVKLSGWF